MVIFSHRGFGFGKSENTFESISAAIKKGFSVEVDLRLTNNKIILSHEPIDFVKDISEFKVLIDLIRENPKVFFAFHLKIDSPNLFEKISDNIKQFENCFLFVTDFEQNNFIRDTFEKISGQHLALYVTNKDLDPELVNKVSYFWLDETKEKIYDYLDYLISFGKRIICCSPELFLKNYTNKLKTFKNKVILNSKIFGICTDDPLSYL